MYYVWCLPQRRRNFLFPWGNLRIRVLILMNHTCIALSRLSRRLAGLMTPPRPDSGLRGAGAFEQHSEAFGLIL